MKKINGRKRAEQIWSKTKIIHWTNHVHPHAPPIHWERKHSQHYFKNLWAVSISRRQCHPWSKHLWIREKTKGNWRGLVRTYIFKLNNWISRSKVYKKNNVTNTLEQFVYWKNHQGVLTCGKSCHLGIQSDMTNKEAHGFKFHDAQLLSKCISAWAICSSFKKTN